jgi:hypothetical protein
MGSYMVEKFLKLALASLGYIGATPHFSLGYCQGDGCSFSCRMAGQDVQTLFERLGEIDALAEWEDHSGQKFYPAKDIFIEVKQSGHYVHWNSMDVTLEGDIQEGDLQRIEKIIEADVKQVCQRLERDGYALLENTGNSRIEFEGERGTSRVTKAGYECRVTPVRAYMLEHQCFGLLKNEDWQQAELLAIYQDYVCGYSKQVVLEVESEDDFCSWFLDIEHHKISMATVRRYVREFRRQIAEGGCHAA